MNIPIEDAVPRFIRMGPTKYNKWLHRKGRDRTQWKTIQARHIHQGLRGTCYFLSAAVNNLQFRIVAGESRKGQVTFEFKFHNELGRKAIVRSRYQPNRKGRSGFTDVVEGAYLKWAGPRSLINGYAQNALLDITGYRYDANRYELVNEPAHQYQYDYDTLLARADKGDVIDNFTEGVVPGLTHAHSYAVMEVIGADTPSREDDQLKLFDPRRTDGIGARPDGLDDGFIKLRYEDLSKLQNSGDFFLVDRTAWE